MNLTQLYSKKNIGYLAVLIGFLLLLGFLVTLSFWTISYRSSATTANTYDFDDETGLTLGNGIEVTGGVAQLHNHSYIVNWTNNFTGTDSPAFAFDTVTDSLNDIYVVGATKNLGTWDAYVRKVDGDDGTPVWTDEFDGGSSEDTATRVAIGPDGNIVVIGYRSPTGGNKNWFVRKYEPDGDELWTYVVDGTDAFDTDIPYDIVIDASNNVYVTGTVADSGSNEAHTLKLTSGGVFAWDNTGINQIAHRIILDNAGDVLVLSHHTGSFSTTLQKIDPSTGVDDWDETYLEGLYRDMDVDSTNNIYLAGANDAFAAADWKFKRVTPSGTESYTNTFAGATDGDDRLYDIIIDDSDNIYIAGAMATTASTPAAFGGPYDGEWDWQIMQLDTAGDDNWTQTITGIDELAENAGFTPFFVLEEGDVNDYAARITLHLDTSDNIVASTHINREGSAYNTWYAFALSAVDGSIIQDGGDLDLAVAAEEKAWDSLLDGDGNLVSVGFADAHGYVAKYEFGYSIDNNYITTDTAYTAETLSSISQTLSGGSTGNLTYQISFDGGTNWYYYSGGWTLATDLFTPFAQSSSASTINTNLGTFAPDEPTAIRLKILFNSDGTQPVALETLSILSGDSGTANFTFDEDALYSLSRSSLDIVSGELVVLDTFVPLADDTQTNSEIVNDYATDVTITPDGFTYSLITRDGGVFQRIPVILQYDEDGVLIDSFEWDPTGGLNHVTPRAIDNDSLGNLYVTGDQVDPVEGESKIFVIKVDTSAFPPLAPDWIAYFQDVDAGNVGDWKGKDISVTDDDAFVYIGGTCKEGLVAGYKFCATKLDTSDGSVDTTWNTTYSATNGVKLIAPGGACDDATFIDTTGMSVDASGDVYLYGDCSQACGSPGQTYDQETNGCGGGGGGGGA